jgi:hypothetical protein
MCRQQLTVTLTVPINKLRHVCDGCPPCASNTSVQPIRLNCINALNAALRAQFKAAQAREGRMHIYHQHVVRPLCLATPAAAAAANALFAILRCESAPNSKSLIIDACALTCVYACASEQNYWL